MVFEYSLFPLLSSLTKLFFLVVYNSRKCKRPLRKGPKEGYEWETWNANQKKSTLKSGRVKILIWDDNKISSARCNPRMVQKVSRFHFRVIQDSHKDLLRKTHLDHLVLGYLVCFNLLRVWILEINLIYLFDDNVLHKLKMIIHFRVVYFLIIYLFFL